MAIHGASDATRFNSALHSATLTEAYALTETAAYWQALSAVSPQTVTLPDPATIPAGWAVVICNTGTAALSVEDSDGDAVGTVAVGESSDFAWTGTDWVSVFGGAPVEIPPALYIPNYWSYR